MAASFRYKHCAYRNYRITLGLWDAGGQARYDSLQNFYCKNARVAIICFDLTDRQSFQSVSRWVRKALAEAEPNCLLAIVGTKLDLVDTRQTRQNRAVSRAEAESLSAELGTYYFETSALRNEAVHEVFDVMIASHVDRIEDGDGARSLSSSYNPSHSHSHSRSGMSISLSPNRQDRAQAYPPAGRGGVADGSSDPLLSKQQPAGTEDSSSTPCCRCVIQ